MMKGARSFSLVVLVWFAVVSSAAAQQLSVANTSRYVGDDQWEWTVFVNGAPEVLGQIRSVEYTLHPTFPQPIVKVGRSKDSKRPYDLQAPFGLTRTGWGVFMIGVKVTYLNGRVTRLQHMLSFSGRRESPCIPQIVLDQEHYQRVTDKRLTDAYVYVADIHDKWRKKPAGVFVFIPASRAEWGENGKLSAIEFSKRTRGMLDLWRLRILTGGEAIQFDYGSKTYRLSVVDVKTAAVGADKATLSICEK